MTEKLFIREDNSVYHSYRFDKDSGAPVGGCNYCGFGNETYWARGTTWAIYGFIIAYSYTKKQEYLDISILLANNFIAQLTEEDPIPVWDFKLPEGEEKTKDTSAGVIAASAFLEIIKYKAEPNIEKFAHLILNATASENYTNYDVNVPGTLKEQNGRGTYTSFGDYYYLEAICKALGIKKDMYW
jgi:unsaturated chondroitin disaccharide hydrolase